MKSLKVFSALFLSSALLTTACTPQDKEVGTPDVMAKIKYPKGTKKKVDIKQKNNLSAFEFGAFSSASVMVEKQVEALEMLQVVLGNTDIAKTLYTISDETIDDKGLKTLSLKSAADEVKYSNKLGDISGTVEKDLKVTFMSADDSSIVIEGKNIVKTNGPGDAKKRVFLNTFENQYKLMVIPFPADPSLLQVTVESSGSFNYRADKSVQTQDFAYETAILLNRASLKEAEIKVVKTESFMDLGTKYFKTSSGELAAKVEGRCNELTGATTIKMARGKTVEISFAKDSVQVTGKDWQQGLATCGQRPTVDVSRLLVF